MKCSYVYDAFTVHILWLKVWDKAQKSCLKKMKLILLSSKDAFKNNNKTFTMLQKISVLSKCGSFELKH